MSALPSKSLNLTDVQRSFSAHILEELGIAIDPADLESCEVGEYKKLSASIGGKCEPRFWFNLQLMPFPHAIFGHYGIDNGVVTHHWRPAQISELTSEQLGELAAENIALKAAAAKHRNDLAKQRRDEIYSQYLAAPLAHGGSDRYLVDKGISEPPRDLKKTSHSFRRVAKHGSTDTLSERRAADEPALMIPLRTVASRVLASAQFVAADGTKNYAWGIPVKGLCYVLGCFAPDKPIYLCEGFATAHVIHRVAGCMTIACLSAGGLKQIARDVSKEYGDRAQIIICAERGGGHAQAVLAAVAVNGQLCEPPWSDRDAGSDFDDYCREHGDEATRDALEVFTAPDDVPAKAPQALQSLNAWVAEVNDEFFFAKAWGNGGQARIGRRTKDGGVVASDTETLKLTLANRRAPGSDREPHTVWLRHIKRCEYDRVAYDPENKTLDPQRGLNLWSGFSVKPQQGDWNLMESHIRENICGGNPLVYAYLKGWLAQVVQRPGTPCGVCVALQGDEGVGKGTLANALLKLFGRHGYRSSDERSLTGEFTGHLEDKSLFYADEMSWAGNRTLREKLWSLITDDVMDVHHKGRTPYTAPNCLNFILSTNKEHAVNIHKGNRRVFLLDVGDAWEHLSGAEKKIARDAYFEPLQRQLHDGGLAAMLHDLLNMGLSGFNVRVFPTTAAMTYNVELSLPPLDGWIVGFIQAGWEEGKPQDKASIYRDYRTWAAESRNRYLTGQAQFWKRLKKVLGEDLRDTQVRCKASGQRTRAVELPTIAKAVENAEKVLGITIAEWA